MRRRRPRRRGRTPAPGSGGDAQVAASGAARGPAVGVAVGGGERAQQAAGPREFGLDGAFVPVDGGAPGPQVGEVPCRVGALLLQPPLGLQEAVQGAGLLGVDPAEQGGPFEVRAGVGGQQQRERRVDAARAVLRADDRTEHASHGVDPLLAACRVVLHGPDPGGQRADAGGRGVVLLGRALGLLVQAVDGGPAGLGRVPRLGVGGRGPEGGGGTGRGGGDHDDRTGAGAPART